MHSSVFSLADLEDRSRGGFAMGPFGSRIRTNLYQVSGVPVLRAINLKSSRITHDNLVFVSPETAAKLKRSIARPGDIVLVSQGNIGSVSYIPNEARFAEYLVSQNLIKLTLDTDLVEPSYLLYWLRSPLGQHELLRFASQTGVPALAQPLSNLRKIRVMLPLINEQRRIAGVLGALDDKIGSNYKQQRIGEQLLRAMIERILGQFSEADFTNLGAYCTQSKESVRPENLGNGDKYIALEHMPRGSVFLNSWENAELAGIGSNKTRFRHNDLLFGKLRPYFKKVGVAPVSGVCSTDILVIRPRLSEFLPFIAVIASSDALIDSISAAATGTRMPRASWKDIAAWPVPQIPDETLIALLHPANQLMLFLGNLSLQNLRLSQFRDALLPELMSGRMRVDEAGRLVSETLDEEVADV